MKVNNVEIKLLDDDLIDCTKIQAETYRLLALLISLEVQSCSDDFIRKYLALSSVLPVWSRLRHLELQGKIQISRQEAVTV